MYNMNSSNFFKSASQLKILISDLILIMNVLIFFESTEDLRPKHVLYLLNYFLPGSKPANHFEKDAGDLVTQSFVENEMFLFS